MPRVRILLLASDLAAAAEPSFASRKLAGKNCVGSPARPHGGRVGAGSAGGSDMNKRSKKEQG